MKVTNYFSGITPGYLISSRCST